MLNMPDVKQQQLVLLGGEHRGSFNYCWTSNGIENLLVVDVIKPWQGEIFLNGPSKVPR